jgi:hypothetical protein
MVRLTGEPTAVRRGTLLLPDCAVMTSPGLREFAPVAMHPWNVAGAGAGRYLPVEGAARPFTGVAGRHSALLAELVRCWRMVHWPAIFGVGWNRSI